MTGLFDFAKDIGRKLFGSSDDDAKKGNAIQDALKSLGIPGLGATFKDGHVELTGAGVTPEQKEKAVLIAGNVQGVEKVTADKLPAQGQADNTTFYLIQSGDTLSKVAQHFYGNANAYNKIFEANREVIEDPNKVYPGQKIRIPNPTQGT